MDTRERLGSGFIAFMFFLCIFSIVVVCAMDGNKSEKIRDEKKYSQGFRDGIDCIALTNLEFSIKKESKTFGELRDICIERILKEK